MACFYDAVIVSLVFLVISPVSRFSGYHIYFGPEAPAGNEGNWAQTMPGKSFNLMFRLYGPLEPWFDKTWQPGDPELVN